MKYSVLILLCFVTVNVLHAQKVNIITGRIISENLESLPGVRIYDMDSIVLGSTDLDGYFEADVPFGTTELLVGLVGMEWMTVKIEDDDCSSLEMIMMSSVIYDFTPMKKINRKRLKRFNSLSQKHKEAYKRGIFKSEDACVCYVFTK